MRPKLLHVVGPGYYSYRHGAILLVRAAAGPDGAT
jgi:hypothetical protein